MWKINNFKYFIKNIEHQPKKGEILLSKDDSLSITILFIS